MAEPPDGGRPSLKKEINALQLWAIAVGLVISGEYFGWNYGWQTSGTIGFLISTAIVTVLYITFIFSFTELTAAIPDAGGAFTYTSRAFGRIGGFMAGYAALVDFALGPPAIAYALGSYSHFLNPAIPVIPTAIACYVIFIGINFFGIKGSAQFSLFITILSVAELLLFIAIIFPYFSTKNFIANNPATIETGNVLAGIPYAIWFFIAIEGVAMVAEEVKEPRKIIPKSYISSILTLVILAFGVMVLSGGVGDWRKLATIDHPMPEILSMALGKGSIWSKIFASLGLFGLIASFHCNVISYSRQIYAMAREGFLPSFLAELHPKYNTPYWALIVGGLIGLIAIFSGTTDQIIILSVMGAMLMYILSILSLFVLRSKEPNLERPFLAPFYPYFPAIALGLSVLSLFTMAYYNPKLAGLFFVGLVISTSIFAIKGIDYVKIPKPKTFP